MTGPPVASAAAGRDDADRGRDAAPTTEGVDRRARTGHVDEPHKRIEKTRRFVTSVVLLAAVAALPLRLGGDPGPAEVAHGTVAAATTIVATPLLLALLVATVTRRLRPRLVERSLWVVMALLQLTWGIDGALHVEATSHANHVLEATQTSGVLVVACFLVFPRRHARLAAVLMTGSVGLSLAIAGTRTSVGGDATFTLVVLVTLALLADGIAGTARILRSHEARARATAQLAFRDDMTGLLNRRGMIRALDEVPAGSGLILLDIDHFKRVNDLLGHAVGDAVIEHVATTLRGGLRDDDEIGRWGGEEFLVVVPGTQPSSLLVMAERLRAAVGATGFEPSTTVSAGVATIRPGEEWAAALRRADQALYDAKRRGRDRVVEAGG